LIAFERRERRISVLIQRAKTLDAPILVPSGALAQAWRDGSRQPRLAALVGSKPARIVDLTAALSLLDKRQTWR
jgi:hypothetical protein